jgi:hypothetical protein
MSYRKIIAGLNFSMTPPENFGKPINSTKEERMLDGRHLYTLGV